MLEDRPDPTGSKFDHFAQKFKLWLVVPLAIVAVTAIWRVDLAIAILIFVLFIRAFGLAVSIISRAMLRLLPKTSALGLAKEVRQATEVTLFLGGFALVGIIVRGDNAISDIVTEKLPDGVNLGFIDPIFAVIGIISVWGYTGYRVLR